MDISTDPNYKDFLWAIELHQFGFEIFGLWPKTDKFARLWSEIRIGIILTLLIFFGTIPMICKIIQIWGDMVLVINNLQICLPYVIVVAKYIIIRWKRTVLSSIVNMMVEDWIAFKLDAERDLMITQARMARLIMTIGYSLIITGFMILTIPIYLDVQHSGIVNITNWDKLLPLQTYYFYDTNKSPQYELTFFIQCIIICIGGIIYMCADIFLILIILHICGQLEIFRRRLFKLVSCKHFNKALNNIVETHLRLIRFAENIENMYSSLMLISTIYFIIVFCLSGFLLTIVLADGKFNEGVIVQVFKSIAILMVLLMNTFLYCGAGEILIEKKTAESEGVQFVIELPLSILEKSNAVHRAMCDFEWYKLESNQARNIILLMMRANHPFYITAGTIIPLTMATFCSVFKTSSGYISFLLQKHS